MASRLFGTDGMMYVAPQFGTAIPISTKWANAPTCS